MNYARHHSPPSTAPLRHHSACVHSPVTPSESGDSGWGVFLGPARPRLTHAVMVQGRGRVMYASVHQRLRRSCQARVLSRWAGSKAERRLGKGRVFTSKVVLMGPLWRREDTTQTTTAPLNAFIAPSDIIHTDNAFFTPTLEPD